MTIKDIARMSGCGVATVSRVLNGYPDVSEETRRRVMAIVEEQGFQPNTNAKHLKQQSSSSVAIIVKGTMNLLFADLVERIQLLLTAADQEMTVHYLEEEEDEVAYAVRLNRERRPKGFLFLGGDLEQFCAELSPIHVPCVLLTNTAGELGIPNLSSFTTDDARAAEQVIDLLAERGHTHIGILGGNWSCTQISYNRLTGCQTACRRWGIELDLERQCEACRYTMPDAYTATQRLMERCPDLTAIFALADVMAIGVIRALRDMGKRVPEDISVVGYDGTVTGQYSVPRLTTVQQDTQRLAERGVETLLQGIRKSGSPAVHELIPFRLLAGESVARLHSF